MYVIYSFFIILSVILWLFIGVILLVTTPKPHKKYQCATRFPIFLYRAIINLNYMPTLIRMGTTLSMYSRRLSGKGYGHCGILETV
jgi:hypothetical protein